MPYKIHIPISYDKVEFNIFEMLTILGRLFQIVHQLIVNMTKNKNLSFLVDSIFNMYYVTNNWKIMFG